ncbi:MAG TPA: TlpA disulfide reductase family protein [Nitrospiraceae bacterium]|jgi:peroxiredoxin|nr:TlpA disulfide reductase family protein [Nitrospiraceae bacterium]
MSLLSALLMFALAVAGCDNSSVQSSAESPQALAVLERGGLKVGSLAPNFQLTDLNGNELSLANYRGKVVLVNFWATWCGPCRVEMPAMQLLYQDFDRKDFEILAVSTDPQGMAVTRPFRDALGLGFPILHDSDFRIGVLYGARTLPMTFILDRDGIITHRIFGARDWQSSEARQIIQNLVKRPEQNPRPKPEQRAEHG